MKLPYIIIAGLLLAGCKKQVYVEFTGTATGIKTGVFTVKTLGDSTIFGENIKDGKFNVDKKHLGKAGYYSMNITDADNKDEHTPYEVYLEDGKYSIEAKAGELYKYPKITSSSKIQEQLSAFYTLADNMSNETVKNIGKINKELKDTYMKSTPEAYNNLLAELQANQTKMRDVDAEAFKQFLKQYPQSEISAHIMSKLDYEGDPVTYYAIFKSLTPEAQKSDEGQEIGDKLSHMINLVVGKKAPAIQGNTVDGKAFDPKSISKKLIVIDFWKAGNELSRRNHDQVKSLMAQDAIKQNVAFVSVSLDSKSDWWTGAVKDDKLDWTQVSDLKGNDSPNAANYNITEIPSYYLLDGNWNIVVPKIGIKNIEFEISQYLKKH
ncbi:MAG: thioredoxin family protein [Bacteroidota bacterium]|nr:thioredoxin family protein [Bacteroidota bacterium]